MFDPRDGWRASSDIGVPLRTYRELVRNPHSTVGELSVATGAASVASVRDQLHELARRGLAARSEDGGVERWDALPPPGIDGILDDGWKLIEGLVDEVRHRSRDLRQLSETFWRERATSGPYAGIEVIRDPDLVEHEYLRLQDQVRGEIRILVRPPFLVDDHPARHDEQFDRQQRRMREGVRYRAIYETSVWDRPELVRTTLQNISAGELARMLPTLPMKLVIADDIRALLPLDPEGQTDGATLLVYPSGLLTAFVAMFEQLWSWSMPITTMASSDDDPNTPTERERMILGMLAAGSTDQLIARRLGVSHSTVARDVATLLRRLDVTTRFQAGAQAVRKGWL